MPAVLRVLTQALPKCFSIVLLLLERHRTRELRFVRAQFSKTFHGHQPLLTNPLGRCVQMKMHQRCLHAFFFSILPMLPISRWIFLSHRVLLRKQSISYFTPYSRHAFPAHRLILTAERPNLEKRPCKLPKHLCPLKLFIVVEI